MRTLIKLTKGRPRVYIILKTPQAKSKFLKQATTEGFILGNKLPKNCKCNDIMIIHSDYTLNYCVGAIAHMCLHQSESTRVDFEKYISGFNDYLIGEKEL